MMYIMESVVSRGRSYRATAAAGLGAARNSGAALRASVVHFRGGFCFGNRGNNNFSFDDCAFVMLVELLSGLFGVLKSSEMRSKLNAVSSAAGLHASKNARSLVRPPELSLLPLTIHPPVSASASSVP